MSGPYPWRVVAGATIRQGWVSAPPHIPILPGPPPSVSGTGSGVPAPFAPSDQHPEPGPRGNVAAEALLAVLRLKTLLVGKRPLRLTQQAQEDATALPFRWRAEIKRFLRGSEFDAEAPLEQVDVDEVLDALTSDEPPDALAQRLGDLDPDLTLGIVQAASAAAQVLREAAPPRARQTSLGAMPVTPTGIERARFRLTFEALDTPGVLLRDLNAGCLTHRQVAAVERAYPGLLDLMRRLAAKEIVDLRAGDPKAELPRARDLQLQILLGSPPLSPELAARMQGNFRDADAATVPGQHNIGGRSASAKIAGGAAAQQTEPQRISTP